MRFTVTRRFTVESERIGHENRKEKKLKIVINIFTAASATHILGIDNLWEKSAELKGTRVGKEVKLPFQWLLRETEFKCKTIAMYSIHWYLMRGQVARNT